MSDESGKTKLEAILPDNTNAMPQPPQSAPQGRAFTAEEAVELLLGMMDHPEMDSSTHEAAIANINKATKDCIMAYLKHCPNNFDRLGAIRRIREALMLARMAITTPQVMI